MPAQGWLLGPALLQQLLLTVLVVVLLLLLLPPQVPPLAALRQQPGPSCRCPRLLLHCLHRKATLQQHAAIPHCLSPLAASRQARAAGPVAGALHAAATAEVAAVCCAGLAAAC